MNYTAANTEDLETPLLLEMDERRDKNNSEAKMIAEIYSAIPVDGAGVSIAQNESCNNGKKDLFRMSTNVIDVDPIIFWGYLLGAALQICAAGMILLGRLVPIAICLVISFFCGGDFEIIVSCKKEDENEDDEEEEDDEFECPHNACLVISFFGLCPIQIIVNQIFANIADIENKKEDENEDEEEDDEYECPHNV